MAVFLITVLVIAVLAALAYPFFVRPSRRAGMSDAADELAQRLRRSRDRVYEEIRALQQEYFLKNLTDEEYREQLQAARERAADLMRQQERVQETLSAIEDAVEEEMQAAVGNSRAVGDPSESSS